MRRASTHRWRGGRVAEGGGLLNRYTVNPVSWVRIPSPPPPKYLILLIYVSLRLSQNSSRLSAALRVPLGRCGRQRRLFDCRCVANPAIISVGDCWSTVWKWPAAGFERATSPCGSILLLNENRQGPNTSVRPVNPNPAGLGEPECAALLRPGERQAGMGQQLSGGEVARMAAFEDRPRDIGRQEYQPQDPREIGARHPLILRKLHEMFALALGELAVEQVRPRDQLDQPRIRSCRSPWRSGLVDQHFDTEAHAPELYRH